MSFHDARKLEAASIVSKALQSRKGWLDPAEVDALLSCYGVPRAKSVAAKTPDEAAKAARAFKGEVALKAVAPGLIHKTEVGAVRTAIPQNRVRASAQAMAKKLSEEGIRGPTFLVQEMVSDAVEMFVGVATDADFGPLLACGAGGAVVELIRDVVVRLTPLTDTDAHNMVTALKTYPILAGYRGASPRDAGALEEIMLRLSELVEDLPEVDELDLNPIMVLAKGKGALVVDARIHVAEAAPTRPIGTK